MNVSEHAAPVEIFEISQILAAAVRAVAGRLLPEEQLQPAPAFFSQRRQRLLGLHETVEMGRHRKQDRVKSPRALGRGWVALKFGLGLKWTFP